MPKPQTYPTLYNEVLQINISKLKELNFISEGQIKSGTLNWSRNGEKFATISISVNLDSSQPYVELDYNYNKEPRKYKVYLTSTPSNLKKGKIWYFLCPQTKKRCRKLYLVGGYFLHREAFNGCMYEAQTKSKSYREWNKTFGTYFVNEDLYNELNKKHFKKSYAGKPTKKYLRIMEQIQKAESIPYHEIESMFLKH